jgi:hypothetical protein
MVLDIDVAALSSRLPQVSAFIPPEYANLGVVVFLAAVLVLDCAYLVWERKRTHNRASMRDALIRKLWKDLEIKNKQIVRNAEALKELNEILRRQKTLLDENPYYVQMKKTQVGLNREYWTKMSTVGPPIPNAEQIRLGEEKERLMGLLRTAEGKYMNQEIDAKTYASIKADYHKKLIETETQLRPYAQKETSEVRESRILEPLEASLREDDAIRVAVEKSVGAGDNRVVLISASSETHGRLVAGMLDVLVAKKGMGGVYISVSQPYEVILSTMEASGIDVKDIYFIDCISKMAGQSGQLASDKVVFIDNPASLEEVSMHVDRLLAKVGKGKKFIFLDSLSSLLIYNDDKSVREFTHYIINKMRLEKMSGAILSIAKKEAEDLVKTLAPMCDAEIRI